MKKSYFLVNFGGPRDLDEVSSFLSELLTDQDVIRSGLPKVFHSLLFTFISRLRSVRIKKEYDHIGGKSPIYEDTEWFAKELEKYLDGPIYTFHRYLPRTHNLFLKKIESMQESDEIYVFSLFPQKSDATTGSIARWFQEKLPKSLWQKLKWIPSYGSRSFFIESYKERIHEKLNALSWRPEETAILASFHGLPQKFFDNGDMYPLECQRSFEGLKSHFPQMVWKMSYQSKFGPGEWLKPYTQDVVTQAEWLLNRKKVLVVPLSFTSDHIETLSEIENQYIPLLRSLGVEAHRVSAINRLESFVQGAAFLIKEYERAPDLAVSNQMMMASYCPYPRICLRSGFCSCVKK